MMNQVNLKVSNRSVWFLVDLKFNFQVDIQVQQNSTFKLDW